MMRSAHREMIATQSLNEICLPLKHVPRKTPRHISCFSISCGFAAFHLPKANFIANNSRNYLLASSIATAQATDIPTMGLLPAPISPIVSTYQARNINLIGVMYGKNLD